MDLLSTLILQMSKDEVRNFKIYSKRTMQSESRKDLELFDLIRVQKDNFDEDKAFQKLYEKGEKNAFYRLKNRLIQDINKNTMLHHLGDETIGLFQLLSLSKVYRNKSNYEVAVYFLKKAEKNALKIEAFEILDLIYSDFIKLSKDFTAIHPEIYIKKRKENNYQIQKLKSLDDILAMVTYKIRTTQNFSSKNIDIIEVLEDTVNTYSKDSDLEKGAKFKTMVYKAVSSILLERKDFASLVKFTSKTFDDFNNLNLFNKSNHADKLQMLTYIANAYYKIKSYDKSLNYSGLLKDAMNEFGGFLEGKYSFYYHNIVLANLAIVDKEEALTTLYALLDNDKIMQQSYFEFFVYANICTLYFDLENYDKSLEYLVKLYTKDGYKSLDNSLKLKFDVAEMIVRYELRDFDFIDYKIQQIRRDYKLLLENQDYQRERNLLSIIKRMANTIEIKQDKRSTKLISEFLASNTSQEVEESEIIQYDKWLKKYE